MTNNSTNHYNIKLNHFHRFSDFLYNFGNLLSPKFFDLFVPISITVRKPSQVIPIIARCYCTGLYIVSGKIKTYKELREEEPNFKGTSYYRSVYILELWENNCSDGYENPVHVGFSFVSSGDLDDYIQTQEYPDQLVGNILYSSLKEIPK